MSKLCESCFNDIVDIYPDCESCAFYKFVKSMRDMLDDWLDSVKEGEDDAED